MPLPSAVAVPTVPSTSLDSVTVLLASAVPEMSGVVSLVRSSVLELPLSEPATRSGDDGAAIDASMITLNADDAKLALPAASVAVAVMECVPSWSAEDVIDQFPLPSAVAVPTVPSTSLVSVIVLFASAVPEIVAVVSLVLSSVLEVPLSEPAARSSDDGAEGAVVSTVTLNADDAELAFPAASVAVAVRL